MLDHYVGQIISYLEKTPDPRRPGHSLIGNTYIIFTSDNGGMERVPGEIITDNFPLDRGKINAKEGGVRVPSHYYWANNPSRTREPCHGEWVGLLSDHSQLDGNEKAKGSKPRRLRSFPTFA